MSRRLRSRLANVFPWLGLLAVACGALGTLITFEPPSLSVLLVLSAGGTGRVPPIDLGRGPSEGAMAGLALGVVTYLVPLGRRTALRVLRPARRDFAATLGVAAVVAFALYSRPDLGPELLRHPDLGVPRWFLLDSRSGLVGCVVLVAVLATKGCRVALRALPRPARRAARLAGACAVVGALVLFGRS